MRANKRFEYVIVPGQRHGYGKYTEYTFWRLADHFTRYLLDAHDPQSVDMMEINREKANKR